MVSLLIVYYFPTLIFSVGLRTAYCVQNLMVTRGKGNGAAPVAPVSGVYLMSSIDVKVGERSVWVGGQLVGLSYSMLICLDGMIVLWFGWVEPP